MVKRVPETDTFPYIQTELFPATCEYISPELLEGRGYDYSYDWWCLGILIYELLVGLPPFFARVKQDMYDKIKKFQGRVPFPPKKHIAAVSKEAQQFIEGDVDRREEKQQHKEKPNIIFNVKGGLLNKLPEQRVGGYYRNEPFKDETTGVAKDNFLDKDPSRFGLKEIKLEPWFKSINWDKLKQDPRQYILDTIAGSKEKEKDGFFQADINST